MGLILIMSYSCAFLLRRTVRSAGLATAIATIGWTSASAQFLGTGPTEKLISTFPQTGVDGFATIDLIAISFALIAAFLLFWIHSIRRRAPLDGPSGLVMASVAPHIEPSRSNIDQLIERIRTAERPDADGLLLNGSKLLESKDEARRLVGVVALETVALGPDLPLAASAIDQLAGHMQKMFRHNHDGEECKATVEALSKAGMKGRRCDRTLTFSARPSVQKDADEDAGAAAGYDAEPVWRLVGGVKLSRYIGGRLEGETINAEQDGNGAVWCSGVRLIDCTVADDAFGTSCILVRCQVLRFNPDRPLINQFVHCNFSGCMIGQAIHLSDMRDHGCWYDPSDPPQGDQPVKWTAFFHQGNPGEQPSWKALLDDSGSATQH